MENTITPTYQKSKHETPRFSRESLHRTFGGRIYLSDFNTEFCGCNTAGRIESDQRFDCQCVQSIIARERNYQDGTKRK